MSRFARQESIIPPAKIGEERIILVGAGAVGRQVGLQLAAAGAKHVQLVDFDKVEEVNIATQGYSTSEIGRFKTDALATSMRCLSPEGGHFYSNTRLWSPRDYVESKPTVIFSCVDSMDCRKSLYHFFKKNESVKLFIDGRMLGETIWFLTVQRTDLVSDTTGGGLLTSYYDDTLFNDSQAFQGRCTSQSTYYASSILASLLIRQFSFHLRDFPIDKRDKNRRVNLLDLDGGFSA